ncbi:MAG: 3-oxoacyl-[acyl-carrier-protein] synthase III C-terminal domain-containing protein [Myxococcota bacterium]
MGTVIEGAALCAPDGGEAPPSSVALAAGAGRNVLSETSSTLEEIGLLVNTGVYRDGHICEPAMAPLILRAMSTAPDGEISSPSGPFAFDLANGAGGVLTAFHAVDALLRTRGIGAALVVASDVDPTPTISAGCDFECLGGAVMLSRGPPGSGFRDFRFDTSAGDAKLLEGRLDWLDESEPVRGKRTTLRFLIRRSESFAERSAVLARGTCVALLESHGLAVDDVDLVVVSRFPADLPERMADALGIGPDRVASGSAAAYTAGPVSGLTAALADGRFRAARRVLFIAVGAGITTCAAIYRSADGESA